MSALNLKGELQLYIAGCHPNSEKDKLVAFLMLHTWLSLGLLVNFATGSHEAHAPLRDLPLYPAALIHPAWLRGVVTWT